jgi:hypothetical protein
MNTKALLPFLAMALTFSGCIYGPGSYGSGLGDVYVSWTLPANASHAQPTCSQAGVTHVAVSIDGGVASIYDCNEGLVPGMVWLRNLSRGSHSIRLWARDAEGFVYYSYAGTLPVREDESIAAEYPLAWAVGGAMVQAAFWQSTTPQNCTQAGLTDITVHLQNEAGEYIYGNAGYTRACTTLAFSFDYLTPGRYWVYVQGSGTQGAYSSSEVTPPFVDVTAGVWPTAAHAVQVHTYKE